MTELYNWKRYWCLRDGGYHIDGNGFLVRSEYFKDTVEYPSIADIPCLVLLGEPGIGKSYAVKDAVAYVSQSLENDRCFPLDLRSFGDEARLFDRLFNGEEIREWLNGDYRLHLFLDSFDECLLRVDTLASLLQDELKTNKYPVDRLLLRIASRTADFPVSLEESLRQVWGGEERLKVYELCPLQSSDILEAAAVRNVDPKAFLEEVVAKNAGTLAARPITLRFLLELYRTNNQLPEKLTELYEQGCRVLCDEQNEDRRTSRRLRGQLTADQRLVITARIAAVMIFANKAAVWKEAETGQSEETDVLLRDLVGFTETSQNLAFNITEDNVREALSRTGLFTARGPNRMGWTHQTFAEFLAAWYVSRHNLEIDEILSLIKHPFDSQGKVTPQLQETGAWLASLREEILRQLLISDPLLLLRSDVASFSPQIRARLVVELLKIFAEEKASDWGLDYQRLKHPDLASQLLPVIKDKNANYLIRRFAIDVADACQLSEIQEDLANIILDGTEPDYVRANAGYALWRIGDAKTRKRVKHIAIHGTENDEDERVRGVALLCNWNENMNAAEAFASIVHSPNLHDAYSLFLGHFTEQLRAADLPVALRWIRDNARNFDGDYAVQRVIDEVMVFAWQNLNTPEVTRLFAEASLVRLRSFGHDLIDFSNIDQPERFTEEFSDPEKRRSVLKAIVPLIDDQNHDSFLVSDSRILRPQKEDVPWLLQELKEATNDLEQTRWLQFLASFYSGWEVDPGALTILWEAYEDNNDAVRKHYTWVFTAVGLDTPDAQMQRQQHEKFRAPRREREERLKQEILNPPPKEAILSNLNELEQGEMDAWCRLNWNLAFRPYGHKQYINELEFDLRKLPGWAEADEYVRARIVDGAKQYLLTGDPQNPEWVGTNNIFPRAFAGYRALYLLQTEAQEFVDGLSGEFWAKWAAIIVCYPLNSFGDNEVIPHKLLVQRAYNARPEEIIKAMILQLEAASQKGESFYFPQRLQECWDDRFKSALCNKLTDGTLRTKTWGQLLEDLLSRKHAATRHYAESVVDSFVNGVGERDRALVASASLVRHAEGNDWWPLIRTAIQRDADFGREVVAAVSDQARPANKLKDDDAAEFYLWLVKMFPLTEDPELPTGHAFAVTPRMEITKFRDSILYDLQQRGTPESLAALEKISAASQELGKKLHWILIEARNNVRRHTWKPLSPAALLALLKREHPSKPLDFWQRVRRWLKTLKWASVPAALILAGLGEYLIGILLLIVAVPPFTIQIHEWPGFGKRRWLVGLVKVLWFAMMIAMLLFFAAVFYKMKGSRRWSNLLPTPPVAAIKVDIAWYEKKGDSLQLVPLDAVIVELTPEDVLNQRVSVPVNLAVANKGDSPLEVVRVELSYDKSLKVESTGKAKIDPSNKLLVYEHSIGTLENQGFYTPLETIDTLHIPFVFHVVPVIARSKDGVPFFLVTIIGYEGEKFADKVVQLGVRIYCKDRPTLNGGISFHLRAGVQLIGLSEIPPNIIDVSKDDVVLFQKIPLGSELLVHWKRRDPREGFLVDYNKVKYGGGVYQYVLIDGVVRRVNADTNADGRLDYELFDSTGDGLPEKKAIASKPEVMIDWTENGLRQ